jgi:hypothetical protein
MAGTVSSFCYHLATHMYVNSEINRREYIENSALVFLIVAYLFAAVSTGYLASLAGGAFVAVAIVGMAILVAIVIFREDIISMIR